MQKKAVALISGGLDSSIAVKLMLDQGIEVVGLNCVSPFCQCDHGGGCKGAAQKISDELNVELRRINTADDFLEILKKPKHGYGSHMNPCIDCRILLYKKAKELMEETGAEFIVSGEVLNQRPMSQKEHILRLIEKESGVSGFVVRPLSAKVLDETEPEKQGWVDRQKMCAIAGRSRREQISLASEFNIKDYPCPAGGCLLTNEGYAKKIKDLIKHEELKLENVVLLKTGRHFRLGQKTKLIVGRNEFENQRLIDLAKEENFLFEPSAQIRGPVALGKGAFDQNSIEISSRIAGRYCDNSNVSAQLDIQYRKLPGESKDSILCFPFSDLELSSFRIS